MERYEIGSFVFSKAGHDIGTIYLIIDKSAGRLILADGKQKTQENPKVKNIKHVSWINYCDEALKKKLEAKQKVTDEEIKYAIKCYKHTKILEEV
ncbi:MAG: KOW domain-containing RNA-binding protein [Parasporobacterium sp.]|nr:KOW domain-containing RNA-binding protein [Parasporobacterium sp.]